MVSFKLETDSKILVTKARKALDKYGHKLVIGNLLDTRKREVGHESFNHSTTQIFRCYLCSRMTLRK